MIRRPRLILVSLAATLLAGCNGLLPSTPSNPSHSGFVAPPSHTKTTGTKSNLSEPDAEIEGLGKSQTPKATQNDQGK